MTRQQTAEVQIEVPPPLPRTRRPGQADRAAPRTRRRILGIGWGWLTVIAVAALLAAALVGWGGFRGLASDGGQGVATFTVVRDTLKVIVTAEGSVRSDKSVDVKSRIEGMVRILEIVPESTRVEAGDFLVRLDISELEKQRATQELKVKQARAAADQAEKELDIQLALNASEINRAKLNQTFAEIELKKYEKGDWPQQLKEAENAIVIAKRELQLADEKYTWSQKLREQDFISDSELKADELARQKNALDVELAEERLNVLKVYTHPKDLTQRQSDVTEATAELARTQQRAAASESKARTDLETKQQTYDLEKAQLDKLVSQIAAGVIVAPQPGLVVYDTTVNRRRNDEVIAVGYQVREGESIIVLPDLNVMAADVTVPEAKRGSIEQGQPAIITLDAQPNAFLQGRVKSRGVLPAPWDWRRSSDVQMFQVIVSVEDPPAWLLPGLRCKTAILVRQLDDVRQVPIQSVFLRGEQHFCYVEGPGGQTRAVPVWVGLDDDTMVEIKAGLETGWKVLLAEPEDSANIALEPPTFEKPTPAPAPKLVPTTQPADRSPTTRPDASEMTEEQMTAFIERIRRFNSQEADRLSALPVEERRQAIGEAMGRIRGQGGRGEANGNRPGGGRGRGGGGRSGG